MALFRNIVQYGSKTSHPRVGLTNVVHIHDDTILNILDGFKLLYVLEYEEVTIKISYSRVMSRDYNP